MEAKRYELCKSALNDFAASTALANYNVSNCHKLPLPLDAEVRLSNAWEAFEALSEEECKAVRAGIVLEVAARLLTYGMRMAMYAVRTAKVEHIEHGLMGLVMDEDLLDDRFVLMIASVLYDAAVRIGVNPADLFQRTVRFATTNRSDLLLGYLAGPDYMKSVNSMGFEIVGTPKEFVYQVRPW